MSPKTPAQIREEQDALADEGYRVLSQDTAEFAAMALSLALEVWPEWNNEKENAMTYLLQELIGQHVKVWSEYGQHVASDEGVLEGFDGLVIKLRKDGDETLYFPVHNVRLVKPLR